MLDSDKQFLLARHRFALTAPQIPVWLGQSLNPEKSIYITAQTLTLRTALDLDRFAATLNRVVAENDALRLRFVESDGEVFQQVVSDVFVNLEFCDFSAERYPEAAANDWIEEILRKPLRAADFPLFHFALAKFATDRFIWLQKYHHLIIDGIGRQLVAARVAKVYEPFRPAPNLRLLPTAPILRWLKEERTNTSRLTPLKLTKYTGERASSIFRGRSSGRMLT
jgi:NRPS condensation-like uncharacterized protein